MPVKGMDFQKMMAHDVEMRPKLVLRQKELLETSRTGPRR